ncbi:hypothetical protein [Thalassospira sp. ER-Se-21-Dark]|nr:hypothetical protein [Thalassospira sp. ER-Se-21-Dark]
MTINLFGAFILEISLSSVFLRLPFVGQGFLDLSGQGLSAWDSWDLVRGE